MKKIILSILVMFSFITKAENSNYEYIFKVKKSNFIVQTSDTENQNPVPNQDCDAKDVSWLNCSTQSSLLTHGQSIEIINTVEEYEGTVTLSCSNGVLSQTNPVCEEKNTFNCDDPANVGQRGTSGECEDLLIVDDSLLRTMINNNENYSGNKIYTGQVKSMMSLFQNRSVNYDITGWNTKNVTNMLRTFMNSPNFDQAIGNWNVSNVTVMTAMFSDATSFNQNINNWNVSNVESMNTLFRNAISFNQPLNNWNLLKLKNISNIFNGASSFNQPLNSWNTSNVTNMNSMFNGATSFNQNINNWNVDNVTQYSDFKTNSALTDENTPSKFLN